MKEQTVNWKLDIEHNNKTVIYVVNVNDFFPELVSVTMPTVERYANKIGAELHIIKERAFPDFPPTYEKIQVYELGKENEWNILFDADLLIHPDMIDLRKFGYQFVGTHYGYDANQYLKPDKYFMRDGRNKGVAAGLVVSSWATHDVWTPLEFSYEEAIKRVKRKHIIDEYCLSRNLAKFGLKATGVLDDMSRQHLIQHVGVECRDEEDKGSLVGRAKEIVDRWNLAEKQ